jgi:hypothetical protein
MIQTLTGCHRRRVNAVASYDRSDENHGTPEFDVNAAWTSDDLATKNVLKPACGCFWIGTSQVDVVPGHYRHFFRLQLADLGCLRGKSGNALIASRAILAAGFGRG